MKFEISDNGRVSCGDFKLSPTKMRILRWLVNHPNSGAKEIAVGIRVPYIQNIYQEMSMMKEDTGVINLIYKSGWHKFSLTVQHRKSIERMVTQWENAMKKKKMEMIENE